jgi:BASS family bile acid:Na+ symporter
MHAGALRAAVAALSALYLVTMMLALGLELGGGPRESKDEKRVKRHALVVGLLFNLVALPLVAFGVTRALRASSEVSIALLLLAATPGGRFAPQAVKLGKGDVALSVEVTIFLAKITCVTAVPLAKWMLTLGTLEIHELPFLVQLVLLQMLPFYYGKWLRKRRPEMAARLRRTVEAMAIATVIAVLAVAVAETERWLGLVDLRSWLAVAVVGAVSPILGWLLGRSHVGHRRALAIGADAREASLALVITNFAFPQGGVRMAVLGVAFVLVVSTYLIAWVIRTLGGRRPTPAGAPAASPVSA